MARNALQRSLESQYSTEGMWERAQEWAPLLIEIRPAIDGFVESLSPRIPLSDQLRTRLGHQLSWDISFICLKCEFSDIVEPIFSIPVLEPWYAAGHFPCGWDGKEFPRRWDGVIREGQLMVY